MAFPLFRLPILVIKLIFETMGFIDLFVLTNASSKSKQIVKNLVRSRNHEMYIVMGQKEVFFTLHRSSNPSFFEQFYSEPTESQPKDVFYLKIGNIDHVPSEFSPAADCAAVLTIYWSPNIQTELYNALIDLFRTPIRSIKMDLNNVAVDTYRSWINWINTSLVHSMMEIVGKCSFPEYVWILKNIRTTGYVALKAEPTDYSDTFGSLNVDFTFKAKTIFISDGRWVELKHLKLIESQKITISRVSLSDFEINTFLQDWKDLEAATNLKKLTIIFEREADLADVLEELDVTHEHEMKADDALNQWSFEMVNGEKCTVVYAKYESNVPAFGFEFRVGNYED